MQASERWRYSCNPGSRRGTTTTTREDLGAALAVVSLVGGSVIEPHAATDDAGRAD
jgi:hypothetical protein